MRQTLVDARRDLAKTASFAGLHFIVAFTVAWLLTGSVAVATGIGLIEPLANTVAFFFHERAWARADARAVARRARRPAMRPPAAAPDHASHAAAA
jgi:uncharacterized membrane protein